MKEIKKVPFINPSSLNRFSLRAAAIINIGERFVFVKNEGKDKYKLPGGHLRADESFSNGLKRELQEELGVGMDIPNLPDSFDQLVIEDLIVITGYFNLGDVNLTLEQLTSNSQLPVALFSLGQLSETNTFTSEIEAIKKVLQ